MPSVDVIKTMFDAARHDSGVIDGETQDRVLAVIAADKKVSAAERKLINEALKEYKDDFEAPLAFRNAFAKLAGQPKAKSVKPVGKSLGAVDLQAETSKVWKEGRLVLNAKDGKWINSASQSFQVPGALQKVKDGDSVLIPLAAGELHMIELEYQDTRKLRDLEFNVRKSGDYGWKTFRGDEWFEMLDKESSGQVEIKRESDHNAPWVNNPTMVSVEVVYPDGYVHDVGTKYLDFHVHDAYGADSSGYRETDNISNGYEYLPRGVLPEGCFLRLTPHFPNKGSWEKKRKTAAELYWVKPIYVPEHVESASVYSVSGFKPIKSAGYKVERGRPIAAVKVEWSDDGGTSSGGVSFDTDDGQFESDYFNVGSGETELIPCDGKIPADGKIHVNGYDVKVRSIEVLYAA